MQQQPAATERTESGSLQRSVRLHGRWLLLARGSWISVVVLTLVIFFGSLPVYVAQLHTRCVGTACSYQQLTAGQVQTLQELGWSLDAYAVLQVVLLLASIAVSVGVSTLIAWRRPDDRMAMLVAIWLVTGAPMIATTSVAVSSSPWVVPTSCLSSLSLVLSLLVFLLFPSGRFAPSFMRSLLVVFLGIDAIVVLFFFNTVVIPGIAVSRLPWLVALGELGTIALAQLYRYRRVSTPLERQQTKWVVFGYAVPVTVNVIGTLLALVPVFAARGSPSSLAVNEMGFLLGLFPPLVFGVAILRYRLWDIDVIINRTLVYGALTASVVGCYILVVGYLGALFRTSGNLVISLIATGLVAVLFQPVRGWLQRGVNRLMYGQRDEPYAVVARLGRRLEGTLAPEAMLAAIVETVAQALKLPYAAITLKQGDAYQTAAVYGAPVEGPLTLPLSYQAEPVGQLVLGPRQRGESFTPADRRLLEDLARQVGIAAHAMRLTSDLQRSRERLVTAREEERRRLRRDLHDGLGPALGSLTLQLDTVRTLLTQDLSAADTLLVELKGQVQTALTDIRHLVYALRPPTLDELGLLSALREQMTHYRQPGLSITFHAPEHLPPLPAAVEVALYRIAQEALTNVVRHVQASSCVVSLRVERDVCLEISDDGQGLPADFRRGVGLTSMRERAAELGGTCRIEPGAAGGTRVVVRLPFPKEEHDGSRATRADC